MPTRHLDTLIIGAGQSGLAAGYYLKKAGRDFLIIAADTHVGETWHNRWDSLRLFTPRPFTHLPGYKMPRNADYYPTKDQMATYLADYAARFDFPIQLSTKVTKVRKKDDTWNISTHNGSFTANNLIIATGPFTTPLIPDFADTLSKDVQQLHSSIYKSPSDVTSQSVVVVGGGNSGAQISVELAHTKDVTLIVSRSPWYVPTAILGISLYWYIWLVGILTADKNSWVARYIRRRGDTIVGKELNTLVIQKKIRLVVGRMVNAYAHNLILVDGTEMKAESIVWATGFRPSHPWLHVAGALDENGAPNQSRGISPVDGLYWVGLPWQNRVDSSIVHGVGHDARLVTRQIMRRSD